MKMVMKMILTQIPSPMLIQHLKINNTDNNNNNTESILSIIQTNIIQNIHRDSQFINNLNPDDLSEIITNHISQNAVNFETPEEYIRFFS